MHSNNLQDWLGDLTLTSDQMDALQYAAEVISTRYAGEDDLGAASELALSGALQLILGDTTLEQHADAWRAAKLAERAAMDTLTGAIAAASFDHTDTGISLISGINRMTVRKALGK